jgi:hypothetical protein
MKNYTIVIWDVPTGSGIEDILASVYKGAAHRSIMNVHNFNYLLRCCKLVYTALAVIFFNSFYETLSTSSTSTMACLSFFIFLTFYSSYWNIERNAALSSMAPIFFVTNRRNYARLAVQHLLDLQSCSVYLRERLKRSFTVNRTNQSFSDIVLNQAIERSINKYGKGQGNWFQHGSLVEKYGTYTAKLRLKIRLSVIIDPGRFCSRTDS